MESYPPLTVINEHLLSGMKVGELFGAGKMQLPFVLQSAETMKRPCLSRALHGEDRGPEKATIVLATSRATSTTSARTSSTSLTKTAIAASISASSSRCEHPGGRAREPRGCHRHVRPSGQVTVVMRENLRR
jgi:hypothetical protein